MWRPIKNIPRDEQSYVVFGSDHMGSISIDSVWFDDGCWESRARNTGYDDAALRSVFQWWAHEPKTKIITVDL